MPIPGRVHTVTEYGPNASTGAYDVPRRTFSGRLVNTAVATQTDGTGAAGLHPQPRLLLDPADALPPDDAQVEVAGVRYNVRQGTDALLAHVNGQPKYRRVELDRVS